MINFDEIVQLIIARGYQAEIREVVKDGMTREAIFICKPDANTAPVIYLDTFDFGEFESMDAIVDELIRVADEHALEGNLNLDFMYDWEQVKSKLQLCMGYSRNFTKGVYTRPYLSDIVQYLRIKLEGLGGSENMVGSLVVSDDLARLWRKENDISVDDIFAAAAENYKDSYTITDLRTLFGGDAMEILSAEMLILSNDTKNYGASAMTCTELLNQVSDFFGGIDFYIVPSSTHEVLAIRPRDEVNAEGLRQMVQSVNDTELAQKELLSYSVFFYERASETVKQAG
jgi:hypothetical protein